MKIEINFLNIILILGLIQGIMLILSAFFNKPSLSKKLFAIIIGILCLTTFDNILFDEVDFRGYSFTSRMLIGFFPLDFIIPLGPLLLFYCRSLFEKGFSLTRSERKHFIPTILEFLPLLYVIPFLILLNLGTIDKSFLDTWVKPLWDNYEYHEALQFIYLSIYLILCFRYLRKVRLGADTRTYRWARDLIYGVSMISIVWLFHIVIYNTPYNYISDSDVSDYFLLYAPIIALFFYLTTRQLVRSSPLRPNEYSTVELLESSQLLNKTIVEKKLYQDVDLKLDALSKATGINQKKVSFILNHYTQKGFNEYINEFRIKQALERLKKGDLEKLTLEGLAMEVGFSSRSTFYRAFKQQTREHPSAYIKKQY